MSITITPILKRRASSILLAAILCLTGERSLSAQSRAPYASDEAISTPRLFAEGIVSTPTDEFGATFTPDGRTVFFSRSIPDSNLYVICISHFENGRWTEPKVAPFSGEYWDFDPVMSPDGNKLLFVSDRPAPGKSRADKDFDIWMVERTASGWSEPKRLAEPINSDRNELFASIASDGTIYFTSDREGRNNFYVSKLVGEKYTDPEKLNAFAAPRVLNWEIVVAPDQGFLLLGSLGRSDSYGSFDIYISFQQDGSWTSPINLGSSVNSRARDYSPRLSPDGRYLFFTSERGFATEPRQSPITYETLERNLNAVTNGWGNIYQIDLEPLKEQALRKVK